MRRLLGHILLALSLLLCAAVAGMWVRSFWYADYLYYTIPEERDPTGRVTKQSVSIGVLQRKGVLQLEWLTNTGVPHDIPIIWIDPLPEWRKNSAGRWAWGRVDLIAYGSEGFLRRTANATSRGGIGWREPRSSFLQFGYAETVHMDVLTGTTGPRGICRLWTVPHWAIGLPGLVVPYLIRSRAWRRTRRRTRGLCVDCGYDLRATPARCPECGREAAQPTTPR